MGFFLREVDAGKTGILIDVGKNTVVLPALPELIKIKQIGGSVFFIVDIRYEAGGYTVGVKQNTIWILQYIEFKLLQGITNMLCKTGTRQ